MAAIPTCMQGQKASCSCTPNRAAGTRKLQSLQSRCQWHSLSGIKASAWHASIAPFLLGSARAFRHASRVAHMCMWPELGVHSEQILAIRCTSYSGSNGCSPFQPHTLCIECVAQMRTLPLNGCRERRGSNPVESPQPCQVAVQCCNVHCLKALLTIFIPVSAHDQEQPHRSVDAVCQKVNCQHDLLSACAHIGALAQQRLHHLCVLMLCWQANGMHGYQRDQAHAQQRPCPGAAPFLFCYIVAWCSGP